LVEIPTEGAIETTQYIKNASIDFNFAAFLKEYIDRAVGHGVSPRQIVQQLNNLYEQKINSDLSKKEVHRLQITLENVCADFLFRNQKQKEGKNRKSDLMASNEFFSFFSL